MNKVNKTKTQMVDELADKATVYDLKKAIIKSLIRKKDILPTLRYIMKNDAIMDGLYDNERLMIVRKVLKGGDPILLSCYSSRKFINAIKKQNIETKKPLIRLSSKGRGYWYPILDISHAVINNIAEYIKYNAEYNIIFKSIVNDEHFNYVDKEVA